MSKGQLTPGSHRNVPMRFQHTLVWRDFACYSIEWSEIASERGECSACTTLYQIAWYCGTMWIFACKRTAFAICIWGAINNTLAPAADRKHTECAFPAPCPGVNRPWRRNSCYCHKGSKEKKQGSIWLISMDKNAFFLQRQINFWYKRTQYRLVRLQMIEGLI